MFSDGCITLKNISLAFLCKALNMHRLKLFSGACIAVLHAVHLALYAMRLHGELLCGESFLGVFKC